MGVRICCTCQMKSQFKVTVRCLTNAGDYDYEDSHELPAGCQYMDMQSSDNSEYSSDSHTAQPPRLADADNSSGHGSAPANAPGSAVAAAEAPVQAPAPSAYMGRVTISSVSPKHSAPTPAPDTAPRNATAPAQAAALSDASAGRPGQGNLLCQPIAARGDAPSGMSRGTKIAIAVLVPVSVLVLLICCCGLSGWRC